MMANLMFFFGGLIIHDRENLLTDADLRRAAAVMEKGDIILVGALRRLSSMVIGTPVTHAILYVGYRTFVHSIPDGVVEASLHQVFTEYDTIVVLRAKSSDYKKIGLATASVVKEIGKPFDFEYKDDQAKFYCSELINYAYKEANISTCIDSTEKLIHPKRFINPCFDVIYTSHNIEIRDNEITLKH